MLRLSADYARPGRILQWETTVPYLEPQAFLMLLGLVVGTCAAAWLLSNAGSDIIVR